MVSVRDINQVFKKLESETSAVTAFLTINVIKTQRREIGQLQDQLTSLQRAHRRLKGTKRLNHAATIRKIEGIRKRVEGI